MLELGGVRDVLTKSIGTQNPINLVKATMQGLEMPPQAGGRREAARHLDPEVLGVGPTDAETAAETISGAPTNGEPADKPAPVTAEDVVAEGESPEAPSGASAAPAAARTEPAPAAQPRSRPLSVADDRRGAGR